MGGYADHRKDTEVNNKVLVTNKMTITIAMKVKVTTKITITRCWWPRRRGSWSWPSSRCRPRQVEPTLVLGGNQILQVLLALVLGGNLVLLVLLGGNP